MEAREHPPPASCLPTREAALRPGPQTMPTPDISLDRAVAKETPFSPGPSGNPNKTSRERPGSRLGGTGWKGLVGTKMGWGGSELSAVQPSRQEDSHSLDRKTDRQTGPAPPLALPSRLPKGFLP